MDNVQNIRDIDILGFMNSCHWKQNAKTTSENASYENSTSQECLQTAPNGNHDIKSLSWEKVLLFLNTMYAFRWPEEDVEICSPESGSLALNEWIFSTQIQGKIFAPVLLDYLDNKKSIKSTSYFSLMEYALEIIDFLKPVMGLMLDPFKTKNWQIKMHLLISLSILPTISFNVT